MSEWQLQRTVQCAKCPWKCSTNPHDIPNGYSEDKHHNLRQTIAEKVTFTGDQAKYAKAVADTLSGEKHVMACHEQHDTHCIGWLHNQLNEGNNIALRVSMLSCTNRSEYRVVGEQHRSFEETFPDAQ